VSEASVVISGIHPISRVIVSLRKDYTLLLSAALSRTKFPVAPARCKLHKRGACTRLQMNHGGDSMKVGGCQGEVISPHETMEPNISNGPRQLVSSRPDNA